MQGVRSSNLLTSTNKVPDQFVSLSRSSSTGPPRSPSPTHFAEAGIRYSTDLSVHWSSTQSRRDDSVDPCVNPSSTRPSGPGRVTRNPYAPRHQLRHAHLKILGHSHHLGNWRRRVEPTTLAGSTTSWPRRHFAGTPPRPWRISACASECRHTATSVRPPWTTVTPHVARESPKPHRGTTGTRPRGSEGSGQRFTRRHGLVVR